MIGSSRRRRASLAAALAVVGGAATGCATTVAGSPVADGAAVTSTPTFSVGPSVPLDPPSNGAPNLAQLAGTWTGTYLCLQGETALTLALVDPAAGPSRFDFSATATNPGVPNGSYSVTLALDGADLVIAPVAWINRPGIYEMVGLRVTGPINSATTVLSGTVSYQGCSTFEVRRQAAH
ncbi:MULTISPECIES: hypothetical protein [Tsukamurella]|uniref:Uncharacterized protein n=2 Tax=Tsukamurella TaxID=2060 RepID=A0A5C5S6H9_9ACTN|nr:MULTISPECIES: hypothetical protein [Tsukamurella]NMD55333.1 hypothetical protein [Tsukamurella columbiensis]TWS30704.1 hypothetical protein FK530_02215 [Tsukamurella conjunctivitidis]